MTVAWAFGTRNRTRLTRPLAPPIIFPSNRTSCAGEGMIYHLLCRSPNRADSRKARMLGRLVVPTHDILRGEVISTLDLVLRTLTDSRGASILALVGPERVARVHGACPARPRAPSPATPSSSSGRPRFSPRPHPSRRRTALEPAPLTCRSRAHRGRPASGPLALVHRSLFPLRLRTPVVLAPGLALHEGWR